MLCVCHTTPTQKLFCLHVFRQAGIYYSCSNTIDRKRIYAYHSSYPNPNSKPNTNPNSNPNPPPKAQ